MKRIQKIMEHPLFIACIEKNKMAEVNRRFCHHDIEHFLLVSHMMYIMCLERQLSYSKDVIYAVGLLHDIGRYKQYEDGTSHDIVSVEIGERILSESNFVDCEIQIISDAILGHRGNRKMDSESLADILYIADKSSRYCSLCKVSADCNWSEEKKKMHLNWL